MLNDSSARPHVIKSTKHLNLDSTKNLNLNGASKETISNALKRRAQSVINDKSIDADTRAVIRYGLEVNDPWLAELVRRIDAGESIFDEITIAQTE